MTSESTNLIATPSICVIDAGPANAKAMRAFAKNYSVENISLEGVNLNPFKMTPEELANEKTIADVFAAARSIGFVALPK